VDARAMDATPNIHMPQLGTTSYLGPWIQMLSNNVAQYLGQQMHLQSKKNMYFW